jgi:hypothetical protein
MPISKGMLQAFAQTLSMFNKKRLVKDQIDMIFYKASSFFD